MDLVILLGTLLLASLCWGVGTKEGMTCSCAPCCGNRRCCGMRHLAAQVHTQNCCFGECGFEIRDGWMWVVLRLYLYINGTGKLSPRLLGRGVGELELGRVTSRHLYIRSEQVMNYSTGIRKIVNQNGSLNSIKTFLHKIDLDPI